MNSIYENKQSQIAMMRLIYDQVEEFKGLYFVRMKNEHYKIIDSCGELIKETEINDVVATEKYLYFRVYSHLGWFRTSSIDDLEPRRVCIPGDITRLPNGCLIYEGHAYKGLLSKSGDVLLPNIYNILKLNQVRVNGDILLYYMVSLGYGICYSGTIIVSSDGYKADKLLSIPVGSMLGADYIPCEIDVYDSCYIDKVLNRCKCKLSYNGVCVGEDSYDEILPNSQLEKFGLVKVADYLDKTSDKPTVGLITVMGKGIIPTGLYVDIDVVNPTKFLGKKADGTYDLYDWSLKVPVKYDIVGSKSLITIPLVSLFIKVGNDIKLLSFGNDGKLHSKPYLCMDIWEYTPSKRCINSGMFLVKLYDKYYYTDSLFKPLPIEQVAKLSKSKSQDWTYRAFSKEDDFVS